MHKRVYTFKNGAKIVYSKYKGGGNATAFSAGFLCGSAYTQNGLSHFFEHMLFKGTTNRTEDQINEDRINICFLNAETKTTFFGVSSYFSNRVLDKGLEFASDVLFNSTFPKESFENEKGVVKEERERKKNKLVKSIDFYHFDNFITEKYKDLDHYINYWFGNDENLDSFTRQNLIDFKDKHFAPSKFIMFVCSTKPFAKIKKLCEKHFLSKMEEKSEGIVLPFPKPTLKGQEGLQVISNDEKIIKIVVSIIQEVEDQKRLYYSQDWKILSYIMTFNNALIYRQLRNQGLTYSVSIKAYDDVENHMRLELYLQTSSAQNIDKILSYYGDTIKYLKENGVTKDDIEGYRFNFLNSEDLPRAKRDNEERLSNLENNYLYYGEHNPYEKMTKKKYKKNMLKSNETTINKTINEIFDENNKVFITFMGNIKESQTKSFDEYRKMIFKS